MCGVNILGASSMNDLDRQVNHGGSGWSCQEVSKMKADPSEGWRCAKGDSKMSVERAEIYSWIKGR